MGLNKKSKAFTKELFKTDEYFYDHCSFSVGGKITYYFEPTSINLLIKGINYANRTNLPYKLIGNGSNILCADSGFDGLIICTKKISKIAYNEKNDIIKAYCGASINELILYASKLGFGGVEALMGIPATVGGAVTMNAGAFGYNISNFIKSVCYYDGQKRVVINNKNCNFKYRDSIFKQKGYNILYVEFSFNALEKQKLEARIEDYLKLRRENQPKGKSCGSVFRNPVGYTAGKMIESVALKGFKIGGAEVSSKHANFIINNGNATSNDICSLIITIKQKVKNIFNVDLLEEVEYIGNFDDIKC